MNRATCQCKSFHVIRVASHAMRMILLRILRSQYVEILMLSIAVVYSQTCSNDHLSKTTNVQTTQANSRTVVTVLDKNLPNATSDHFFCLPNEIKTCLKQPLQNFPSKKRKTNKRQHFSKYMKLSQIIHQFVSFFFTGNKRPFWNTLKQLWWGFFAKHVKS